MPSKLASSVTAFLVATGLMLATAFAAEPPHPLLGLSREQVLQRMGEPRSQMAAGGRGFMLYARERVVLRDGIVVDVERVAAEPVRRAAPVAAPAASAAPAPETAAVPGAANPAVPAEAAATVVSAPGAPAASAAPGAPAAQSVGQPAPVEPAAAPHVETTPPPEPKLEIKLVRPPSAGEPRPKKATVSPVAAAPAPKATTAKETASAKPAAAPTGAAKASSPLPTAATATAIATPVATPAPVATKAVEPAKPAPPAVDETPSEEEKLALEQAAAAKLAAEKKAKVIKAARRRMEAAIDSVEPVPAPPFWTIQNIILAVAVAGGAIGYLIWRLRQRQLELEASAVSHSPFSTSTAGGDGGGSLFTAESLAKLEWKRFEELVEAYYSKTGVVAARTKGGPSRPSQVRISWKGEPRPFALVRCISNPDGLIEIAPMQELNAVLAAEDVRRGYVVTTGKFAVAARDYAEEKHLTLLPGEIFLEKLNALPGAARAEITAAVMSGDCSTPSCPTCEEKMAKSAEEPPVWRCANHPDVTFRA